MGAVIGANPNKVHPNIAKYLKLGRDYEFAFELKIVIAKVFFRGF